MRAERFGLVWREPRVFHWRHLHLGTDMILSQLRQHYLVCEWSWKEVRGLLKEWAKPSHQQMAYFPKERLAEHKHPLCHTTVEYFGPMEVELSRNRTDKRYGALFTCQTTGAVYLYLTLSLSSDDFLNLLPRFVVTYSTPEKINSDNETNFVGAEKELLVQLKNMPES